MTLLGFVLINFLIFGSWFLYLSVLRPQSLRTLLVYTGSLGAVQIYFVQLTLGILHLLYLPWIIALHLGASLSLLGWSFGFRKAAVEEAFRSTCRKVDAWFRSVFGWENVFLLVLMALLGFWGLIAVVFLPPRGIDDLVYHLPSLYQFVQNHQIELLPLELRKSFAMPLSGDFLFLWPLVFFHSDVLMDGVGFFVVLYGVGVLYALAREIGISQRDAFFAGLLFVFIPLALGQVGSNYNDLMTAVCYLALLFAAVRFYHTGEMLHLVMAGIMTGYGLGIKYSMFVFVLGVQPIIWLRFLKDKKWMGALGRYSLYWVLAFPISLYWFVRNFLETGFPFYPRNFGGGPDSGMVTDLIRSVSPKIRETWTFGAFWEDPIKFLHYPFYDLGLGSFHGGFGVVFWGIGIPAFLFCFYRAVRKGFSGDFFPLFFWGQMMVGFYSIFLTVIKDFQFNQRYIFHVVWFGLLALGIVLQKLRQEIPSSVGFLKGFCAAVSVLAVIHMASYGWPTYQIKGAVEDWVTGQQTSQYKYLRQSPWDLPSLSLAWEPLDYLTRDGEGWSVYTAATHGVFWVTPAFGSQLQNRIWNFDNNPVEDPDAFIFHYDRRVMELFYLGRKITPQEVQRGGNFELVTQTSFTQFWVKKTLLEKPGISEQLKSYYKKTFGPWIQVAEKLKHHFAEDGVIVTSSPLGYGFKYLQLNGDLSTSVYLVPRQQEEVVAQEEPFNKVYTIERPLNGFESSPIAELAGPQGNYYLYENLKSNE